MPDYTTDNPRGQVDLVDSLSMIKQTSMTIRADLHEYYTLNKKEKVGFNILHCNDYLQLMRFADAQNTERLVSANNCRSRFCPICSHKKARSDGLTLMLADSLLDFQCPGRYERYHLSLSCENCTGKNLRRTIQGLTSACTKFMRYRSDDYYRKLEITYNDENDTYHPHLHVLVYSDRDDNYWLREGVIRHEFASFLAKEPKVDHSRSWAECKCSLVDDEGYIFEMSKYVCKDADIEKNTIPFLIPACQNLRFVAVRGVIKPLLGIAKELLDDLKKREIISLTENYSYKLISYAWNGDKYLQTWIENNQKNGTKKTDPVRASKITKRIYSLARKYASGSGWIQAPSAGCPSQNSSAAIPAVGAL